MVGEVVDHEHAFFLAAHFRTSLHVLKTREGTTDLLFADAPCISRNNHGETVQEIELPDEWSLKLAPRLILTEHFKPRESLAELGIADLPLRARVSAESLQAREESFTKRFDYRAHIGTVPAGDQPAVLRYEIHEAT